jgi:hypothetical protein
MATVKIDIERRLELAVQELLKTETLLTDLVTANGVVIAHDRSASVIYPAASIGVINAMEFGLMTGWYMCGLQLSALTYRQDDESRSTLKQIAGVFRGWAQKTGVVAALNATAIATATATVLGVEDVRLDDMSFDNSEDKIQELVVPVSVLCRPSQATTT